MLRLLWLALWMLVLVPPASAHDPQLSGLRIVVGSGKTLVSVTTHISQLAAAENTPALEPVALDQAIRRRLRLVLDGVDFVPQTVSVLRDDTNDLVIWQARAPKEQAKIGVRSRLYPEDPTSAFIVSVTREGRVVQEVILNAAHPALLAEAEKTETLVAVMVRYLRLGVLHIFGGPDHIAFVVGLLLLGGTLRALLKTVTAFTLAHSITLSLAATGVYTPSPRLIEPLIALSIVVVAVENLVHTRRPAARDLRPYFALGFGLIHGFGFAGSLAEIGLPKNALAVSLAAFNGGIELGQGAIVVVVAPLLARLALKNATVHRRTVVLGSLLLGVAGLFWFVTRLLV